jgi:hypothetical protein
MWSDTTTTNKGGRSVLMNSNLLGGNMNDLMIGIDQTEQTILTREISDDDLEVVAGSWGAIAWPYTL